MDSPPVLLPLDSELGQAYIEAMTLAGEYAYAGRDTVCAKVLEILGAEAVEEVHNHHNFAWIEEHDGRKLVVVRKGATPIWPGQRSFVGGSMGDMSVIIEGKDGAEAKEALYSTVHGAGRVMSRTQAAGKFKKVPHPTKPGKKIRVRDSSTGLIDFEAVQDDLARRGIELRGGAADEAPGVYKPLSEVLAYHADSITVVHTLQPIGVAMAGADTFDPYKD
jgi:tRNA-splicing ligase RtcB